MDDGRLLRGLMDTLAVDVDEEGEQPRPEETGNTGGDQVDGGECWERKSGGSAYILFTQRQRFQVSRGLFVSCIFWIQFITSLINT